MTNKSKILGQVYTPIWIVKEILDEVGYFGETILSKYILEPACGDGAFLCEIVQRYIFEAKKLHISEEKIAKKLEQHIYGIEIDVIAYEKCLQKLSTLVKSELSENIEVKWNIFNENTLFWFNKYVHFFDFVVGNPPYIRIHNLDEQTRNFLKQKFQFSQGTIDIYLSFFEIGFKVLNNRGKLGYITPNSFLHNTSYKNFRLFLKEERTLKTLVDFKHHKVFQGFSTYTAISIFDKVQKREKFDYKEFQNEKIIFLNSVKFNDLNEKKWSFSDEENEKFLNSLFSDKNSALKDFFDIQYGFATLRDKIFIGKIEEIDDKYCLFNNFEIEKSILNKIVKGSKYKGNSEEIEWILFPYVLQNGRYLPISEKELKKNYLKTYQYLLFHKEELEKRDMDKGAQWYEFGRSQGVQSIHKEKIVLSTLVNGEINYYKLPKDIFVYSGIFITQKNHFSDWKIIEDILQSNDFYRYIRITGKDFSGGYKSISTKQIKEFKLVHKNPLTLF